MGDRIKRKMVEAVSPHLEEGEEVRAVYLGQTPIPPITYLLVGPLLFVFIIQFKTFVATDRNLYVFSNKWMRSYAYKDQPYKVPIENARFESGSTFARVDDGPKAWCAPFGPVKKRLNELSEAVRTAQGQAQAAA